VPPRVWENGVHPFGRCCAAPSTSSLNGPLMPDQLNAKDRRSALGKTVALWLLETVTAFVTAWLFAVGFCFLSAQLGLRLPSFTCGRTFGTPFMISFVIFWPMFVFLLPLLVPKLAVMARRPSNNRRRGP
jgi:hypothetical protein